MEVEARNSRIEKKIVDLSGFCPLDLLRKEPLPSPNNQSEEEDLS